jgi:hypothetical protein
VCEDRQYLEETNKRKKKEKDETAFCLEESVVAGLARG